LSRRREIEAAISAYNDLDQEGLLLLPPEAGRLLAVMFPRDTVFRSSVTSLSAEGFNRRIVVKLAESLIEAGFLSREGGRQGFVDTYRLHLPPTLPDSGPPGRRQR
jgi:hypothetical protein